MKEALKPPCPISGCDESHDDILTEFVQAQVRRISDGDLAGELLYVRRELADVPEPAARPWLRHRGALLEAEANRRERIARRGGPGYNGRPAITPEHIADLKQHVSLDELVARHLSPAWMKTGRTWYKCPFHKQGQERTASFIVYESDERFHCFSCGADGDALDFLMAWHNVGFLNAVALLEGFA